MWQGPREMVAGMAFYPSSSWLWTESWFLQFQFDWSFPAKGVSFVLPCGIQYILPFSHYFSTSANDMRADEGRNKMTETTTERKWTLALGIGSGGTIRKVKSRERFWECVSLLFRCPYHPWQQQHQKNVLPKYPDEYLRSQSCWNSLNIRDPPV